MALKNRVLELIFITIVVIALLALMSSCRLFQPCQTIVENVKDSSEVKEVYKLDTFWIQNPADSSLIMALIECDSLNQAQMFDFIFESPKQDIKIGVKDGVMKGRFICKADSLQKVIRLKELEHYFYKQITKAQTIVVEKKQPLNKVFLIVAIFEFVLIFGYIILKLIFK